MTEPGPMPASGRRLVLFGPPGSGKGTQAQLLEARTGQHHLATGDILRAERAQGTALGARVGGYMDRGELVPDEVIIAVMAAHLQGLERTGFIFDGFPRTVAQARALDSMLTAIGRPLDGVVVLEVPMGVLETRLLGRAEAEGRSDDTPETVRKRMRIYQEATAPVLDYYSSRLPIVRIDGDRPVSEVLSAVLAATGGITPRPV